LNKGPFHFDGLLTVPFIVRWPAGLVSGRTVSSLTSHLDFLPTLLDEAGLKYPEGAVPDPPECARQRPALVGASLTPLLTGAAEAVHDAVLVENDEDYIGSNLRTVVTDRYKLTCYSGREYGELFDLERDPGELHNLWDDPASAGVKRELQVRLLDVLMETESPLPRRMSHA
jgi:arylsulfatase